MDNAKPPQIKNESLGIDDTNSKTTGGPPGWLALAIVGGLFLAVAFVVFIVLFLIR